MVRREVSASRLGGCRQRQFEIGRTLDAAEHKTPGFFSGREALAALGAPGVDDATATARLHAREKAVRAGTTDFGRLIRALHVLMILGCPISVELRLR